MSKKVGMARHVAALTAAHRIRIDPTYAGRGGAVAIPRRRVIRVPPRGVAGAVTYLAALHEIGHIVGPMQVRGRWLRLDMEAGAWWWAIQNADDALVTGAQIRREVGKRLGNYARRYAYKASRGSAHKLPGEGALLWRLLELVEAEAELGVLRLLVPDERPIR